MGGVGLVVAGGVFVWLPRVDTVSGRAAFFGSRYLHIAAAGLLWGDKEEGIEPVATLAEARERLKEGLSAEMIRHGAAGVKEGDGPGDYQLEEQDGGIFLRTVDLHGREQPADWLVGLGDDGTVKRR
jgi:hypothetical protein